MAAPDREARSLMDIHKEKVQQAEQQAREMQLASERRAHLLKEREKWLAYREKRRAKKDKIKKRKAKKRRKRKKRRKQKKKKKRSRRRHHSSSTDNSDTESSSSSSSESSSLDSEEDFKLFLKKKEALKKKIMQRHIEKQNKDLVRQRKQQEKAAEERHKKLQKLYQEREARMAVHNQAVERKIKEQAAATAKIRRQREHDREAIQIAQRLVAQKKGPWETPKTSLPLRAFTRLPGLAWATMDLDSGRMKAKKCIDGKDLCCIDEW